MVYAVIAELPYHPMFVHFPIALLIAAGLFTILALFVNKEAFLKTAFWMLVSGSLGSIAAVITGHMSEEKIKMTPAIHNILEIHETIGFIIMVSSILLVIWFIVRRADLNKLEHSLIAFIFVIVAGLLSYQGFLGGEMVYAHGAAVNLRQKENDFTGSDDQYKNPHHKVLDRDSLNQTLSERVANAYGINNFPKVKIISYTFNVKFNGKEFHRSWSWNPATDEVTYMGKDDSGKNIKKTYNRNEKMDAATKKIDAAFINDNYWLLFPYHLVWDEHVDLKDVGMKELPIGKGEGNCLIVKYVGDYGYTPGDEFRLFLNKDNKIKQWLYLHSGNKNESRPATWEGNKNFGGIIISTLHKGPDNKFRLWFSDIKVQY